MRPIPFQKSTRDVQAAHFGFALESRIDKSQGSCKFISPDSVSFNHFIVDILYFIISSIHQNNVHGDIHSAQMIIYKKPNPHSLQYLSLYPLVLDLTSSSGTRNSIRDSVIVKNINTMLRSDPLCRRSNTFHSESEMEKVLNKVSLGRR